MRNNFITENEREQHRLQMCVWETKNKYWSTYIMGGGGGDSVKIYHGRKYTPLYKKGIKKDQNKEMETTVTWTQRTPFE